MPKAKKRGLDLSIENYNPNLDIKGILPKFKTDFILAFKRTVIVAFLHQ